MSIRIVIADDHRILREGIARMLADRPEFEIVGEAENGHDAIAQVGRLLPDVILMDVSMPELNGVDAVARLRRLAPRTAVLAMSMHVDHSVVKRMLAAGANGYLIKGCGLDELCEALTVTAQGRMYLSPELPQDAQDALRESLDDPRRGNGRIRGALSPREREVLQLLSEGKPTKVIASKLGLSTKTVENHRKQVREKLDLHSTAELTKYAIREGLTDLGR